MRSESFTYSQGRGWSVDSFPDLDSANTLVLSFAAPEYYDNPELFEVLAKHYPQAHLMGCSTAGEINGAHLLDHSVSVAVLKFDATTLRHASVPVGASDESFSVGMRLAIELDHSTLRGVFVLSDGLGVNGSELVRGMNEIFDGRVTVTGGLAGDGCAFKRTYVINEGRPAQGVVTAIGFYGDHVHIGHGSRGGWDKFGHIREVTRSRSNVLYELDGKPALDVYKEYLGERANELPASALLFPLAIWLDGPRPHPVVRSILAVSEEEQSMTFAGDVPEGAKAQFLYANFDRVIHGAGQAAQEAVFPGHERGFAVGISCVGRRLVLADRTEEELEAVLDSLPRQTPMVGFYSYGEISPHETGYCDLHNQSMTLTTIYEAA